MSVERHGMRQFEARRQNPLSNRFALRNTSVIVLHAER